MDEQSFIKRKRILEAIDVLRERKNRPDIERIGNYLFRQYKVPPSETKSDLEWCVSNRSVLCVEYKGAISYRNALKKKSRSHHNVHKSRVSKNFMKLLTNVFAELTMEEPHYLEIGVPATEIIQLISMKDSVRYTKRKIAMLLQVQVRRKNLIKMENGNFMLGLCSNKKTAVLLEKEAQPLEPQENQPKTKLKARGRPHKTSGQDKVEFNSEIKEGIQKLGRRLKIAKKVFDPSDTYAPKRKKNQKCHPSKSLNKSYKDDEDWKPTPHYSTEFSRVEPGVCSVCHNSNEKNAKMITCIECSNKAHRECLNGDNMMSPENTWECTNCKTCVVCFQTSSAGNLIVCSVCADGYHASCHQPKIADKIENNQEWLCENCQGEEDMNSDDIQFLIGKTNADTEPSVSGTQSKNSKNMEDSNDSFSQSNSSTSESPVPSGSGIQRQKYLGNSKNEEDSSDCSSRESPAPSEKNDSNSPKITEIDSENLDPSLPDANDWTPDEVYEYFAKIISEDEAEIFREERIDGRSLLCLDRSDVLNNLKLELDTALEVFRHITMLQVKRDDRGLYWL